MTPFPGPDLLDEIKRDEGFSATPYRCPAGQLTIGYGSLIESISQTEADWLLRHRLTLAILEVRARWPWVLKMSQPRQDALYAMAYNMGVPRLAGFKKMLAALEAGDYATAAAEALDSKWANQVGQRADRIARRIRDGE